MIEPSYGHQLQRIDSRLTCKCLVQHAPGLKPRDRSLCPFFHQISRQPSRFSMRRVVGEEVSLSMPASVNDDKCEEDSK